MELSCIRPISKFTFITGALRDASNNFVGLGRGGQCLSLGFESTVLAPSLDTRSLTLLTVPV